VRWGATSTIHYGVLPFIGIRGEGRGEGAGFFPSASRMRDSSEGGEIGVRELEVERGYLFRGALGVVKRNETNEGGEVIGWWWWWWW
jgi:hypothetical protein